MTAPPTFTRRRPRTGYGQIPNGLWTLGVPMGARVLLGWLHSHTDEFLAGLTVNKCRRALGTSQIDQWLEALEKVGLITVDRSSGKGKSWTFDLDPDAWVALSDRSDIGSPTDPISAHPRSDIGSPTDPISARVGEPIQNTIPEHQPPPAPPSADAVARELLDAYWLWVKAESGHPPVVAYLALVNIVRPLVEAGWNRKQLSAALATMYRAGRTLSRQSVEVELRRGGGRPGPLVDEDRSAGSGVIDV